MFVTRISCFIYSVQYYPQLHITAGLGIYYLRIQGNTCILKPCSFARSATDQLKMVASLQWLSGFHFHIKLILVQLQFSNLHEQKQF
jgi:hypothetical protein